MQRLVFVKLGGSILTDKTRPEAVDAALLGRVAATLADCLRQDRQLRLLIGHGGGSFGHYWAARYATHRGVRDAQGWEGVARVADAMGRLNRLVVGALLEAGIQAVGVQPSASALAHAGALRELATTALEGMLAAPLTPVIYGDVVLDSAQGATIVSTEALFAYLAPRLQPQRIVLLGERGVFTADPRRDPQARLIARIDPGNIATVLQQVGGSHGTDVTGGMAAKVRQMWQVITAQPDLEVVLIGAEEAAIRAAVLGGPLPGGTLMTGHPHRAA